MAADEKWYFTKEQLANTPSRKNGIDADKELSYRQQAANFIQDMGQRLQVYPFYKKLFSSHLFITPLYPLSTYFNVFTFIKTTIKYIFYLKLTLFCIFLTINNDILILFY